MSKTSLFFVNFIGRYQKNNLGIFMKKVSFCIFCFASLVFAFCVLSCNVTTKYKYITIDKNYSLPTNVYIKTPHIFQNDQKSCATTSVAIAVSYYLGLNDAPLNKENVWKISESKEEIVSKYGNDMAGLKKLLIFMV
jgi:hypothetical protein